MKNPLIKTVSNDDPAYPFLLLETGEAPTLLYYRGELPSPSDVCIAIVGTRKATREGLSVARTIAYDLAKEGFTIVSGLALGIDRAAHEGALQAKGKTFAVLANGLDQIYPHEHESLGNQIIDEGGGLISEYPPHSPSLPHQFLERNRITSGLSVATIVIEAPIHSGALSTARHALQQGREIFVVPGPAQSSYYEGSHMLIREGARLVTNTREIIEDILPLLEHLNLSMPTPNTHHSPSHLENSEDPILGLLKNEGRPLSVDTIIEMTTLDPHMVQNMLSLLVIDGSIEEHNGLYRLIRHH